MALLPANAQHHYWNNNFWVDDAYDRAVANRSGVVVRYEDGRYEVCQTLPEPERVPPAVEPALNILNREAVEASVVSSVQQYPEHVRVWAKKAITKELIRNHLHIPVLDEKILDHDMIQLITLLVTPMDQIKNRIHFVDTNAIPTWAQHALKNREKLFWLKIEDDYRIDSSYHTVLQHLTTLPEKSITGMTFEDASRSKANTEYAEYQRRERERHAATIKAANEAPAIWSDGEFSIHRLTTLPEVLGEGEMMLHCMRNDSNAVCYMESYDVYSLRHKDESRPRVTFTALQDHLLDAKAYRNNQPEKSDLKIIKKWLARGGGAEEDQKAVDETVGEMQRAMQAEADARFDKSSAFFAKAWTVVFFVIAAIWLVSMIIQVGRSL
jgi:hypothetical protein